MTGFDDMAGEPGAGGGKDAGAMLSIGELANRLGVPTHVLRYWETRFDQLQPLQRSGRRRYYRPEDVALAEQIHQLLHVQGFTVDGARRALAGETADNDAKRKRPAPRSARPGSGLDVGVLRALRDRLAQALNAAA